MDKNIVLIGFMGTGKSAIGQRLARKLGLSFVDTDREIEELTGKSIPMLFKKYGEKRFRSEEKLLVARLGKRRGQVVACGGGTVLEPQNREILRQNGILIWIDAEPEDVFRRVRRKRQKRPLLKKGLTLEQVHRMMEERKPYYEGADFRINTSRSSIEDVVNLIINKLEEMSYEDGQS